MTQDDGGAEGSGGCPVSELLAAILGTFFGTLLFCVAMAILLVVVYRRRQQKLMTTQRLAGECFARQLSCLINAQPLPVHCSDADDNSLIGCTRPRPDR